MEFGITVKYGFKVWAFFGPILCLTQLIDGSGLKTVHLSVTLQSAVVHIENSSPTRLTSFTTRSLTKRAMTSAFDLMLQTFRQRFFSRKFSENLNLQVNVSFFISSIDSVTETTMDYRMTGWLLQTLLWVFLLIIDTLFPKSLKFGNSYHSLSPHEVE